MTRDWEHTPGSPEAGAEGCTCAVIDNAHGLGIGCDGERFGWWISGDCPYHVKPKEA